MQNNVNFYRKMEEQIRALKPDTSKKRLLLHCCCAPCSSHCLELLSRYFDITAYFYNPNIVDEQEFNKRFSELKRFVNEVYEESAVKVQSEAHESEKFLEMAKGKENLPEGGARCYDCYRLRMEKSAQYASLHNYDYFTTTLSISPHKNAVWINEIGEMLSGLYQIPFLYSDFKKRDGYRHSIELSAKYHLYRQNFCGCEFSRRDGVQAEKTASVSEK